MKHIAMLPKVSLSQTDYEALLQMTYMADVLVKAGALSMDMIKKLQEDHPEYCLEGIPNQTLNDAIIGQNLIGIPFDQQQKFLRISSDRQQFKRSIIDQVIRDEKNALQLEPYESILISGCLRLAPLFDELFIQWREHVVYSGLGREFEKDSFMATEFRKKHHLLLIPYVYSVIQEKDGKYLEQSLIHAFPVLVKRIVEELRKLNDELILADADVEITDYIEALGDFYENEDPEKYEFMSKVVDGLWLKLPAQIYPIHAMEVYQDPGKYIVSPTFDLAYIDKKNQEINDGILKMQSGLISFLNDRYPQNGALKESNILMEKAKAQAVVRVVESGESFVLRAFGQNQPNWNEIRNTEGVRISIMMETAKSRWIGERMALVKVFGEERIKELYDPYIANEKLFAANAIVHVGGHEIAHNAFNALLLHDRISPPYYAKMEETKATYAAVAALEALLPEEQITLVIQALIAYSLMKMQQVDDPTVIAYVYESFSFLHILFQANIIQKTESGYTLSLEKEKMHTAVTHVQTQLDSIASIYDTGTDKDAEDHFAKYFVRDENINELILLLNA